MSSVKYFDSITRIHGRSIEAADSPAKPSAGIRTSIPSWPAAATRTTHNQSFPG